MSSLVRGHALVGEGAPFERVGTPFGQVVARRTNLSGIGGEGRALCSCKDMSDVLPSAAARKAWHRDHKAGHAAKVDEVARWLRAQQQSLAGDEVALRVVDDLLTQRLAEVQEGVGARG